jgi:hypothetical protein
VDLKLLGLAESVDVSPSDHNDEGLVSFVHVQWPLLALSSKLLKFVCPPEYMSQFVRCVVCLRVE